MDRRGFEECQPMRANDEATLYRVPVYVINGTYTVSIGNNWRVMFTSEQLPAEIRSKLGMIFSLPTNHLNAGFVPMEGYYNTLAHSVSFISFSDPTVTNYTDIGWRVTTGIYIVVISRSLLEQLRGEPITDDPVEEGDEA
jgi:hypothetical protein